MNFIKLTEVTGNTTKEIIINFDYVQVITMGLRGNDTYIRMTDKGFYFVRESLKEINDRLNFDSSNSPMVMSKELAELTGNYIQGFGKIVK